MVARHVAKQRVPRGDALGFVLGEEPAVEPLTAPVVRLGGEQDPGAVGAGGPDRQLELGAQVGVEGRLADVAPPSVLAPGPSSPSGRPG